MSLAPFEQSPQARWKIVQQPGALPGSCFMCNGTPSEERQWFVDTGLQFDFWGAVYICNLCLFECAHTAGWITPVEAQNLQTELEDTKRQLFVAQTEVASLHEMEQAVDSFVRARDASRGGDGSGSGVVVPLHFHQADGADAPGTSGAEGPLGTGAGTAPEPSDGQGMDELRSDAVSTEFRLGFD